MDKTSKEFKEYRRKKSLEHYHRTRIAALSVLGAVCKHCGFKDKRALQIDHVKSNGADERKLLNQRDILYRVIDHPEDYQVLCANCNQIKKIERGECYNKTKKMAGN